MKRLIVLIRGFLPPGRWIVPVAIVCGVLLGIVALLFRISNATSYLSSDPKACINCHVMFPQYETWKRSSHRDVAKCTDCHIPQDSVVRKYLAKGEAGFRHSAIFTMRTEPQVIRMHEAGQAIVQENCIRCHENLLDGSDLVHGTYDQYVRGDAKLCWECHREVPHGRVKSLAATPYYHVPQLSDPLPDSLKPLRNFIEDKLILPKEKKP